LAMRAIPRPLMAQAKAAERVRPDLPETITLAVAAPQRFQR